MIKKILLLCITVFFALNYAVATEMTYIKRLTEEVSKDSTINFRMLWDERVQFSTFWKEGPFLPLADVQELNLSKDLTIEEIKNIIDSLDDWKTIKIIESKDIILAYDITHIRWEKKLRLLLYKDWVIFETNNHKTWNYLSVDEHTIGQLKSVLTAFIKTDNTKKYLDSQYEEVFFYTKTSPNEFNEEFTFIYSFGCLTKVNMCFEYSGDITQLLDDKIDFEQIDTSSLLLSIDLIDDSSSIKKSVNVWWLDFEYRIGEYSTRINWLWPIETFYFYREYEFTDDEIVDFLKIFID